MVNALLIYMGKTPKGYLNLAIAVPAEEDVTLDAIKDSIQDFVSLRVKSGYKIRVNGGNVVIDVIGKKSGAVAVALDDYIIESCVKEPSKFRYVCKTKSGVELTVLLRWKNGNGIAFPAFQISARKGEVLR